ncbi:MAG: M48 family metallopeptidase [bacterium]
MPFFRIIRRRIRVDAFGRIVRRVRLRRRARRTASLTSRRAFSLHKEPARAIAHVRLEHFARFYATLIPSGTASPHVFTYHRVSIRNQRTRWGSCSRRGNLNFSYKLALLPPHLADYLIVHELCHLGQFNHSPAFWALVALAIPEYRTHRDELKHWREPK